MTRMFAQDTSSGRDIAVVFVVAMAVRLANVFAFGYDPSAFLIEDSPIYLDHAALWLKEGAFLFTTSAGPMPETERLPLYSLIIAGLWYLFGDSLLPIVLVQVSLDSVTCLGVLFLGRLIGPGTGLLAGLLAAINPNLVIHSATILNDTVFMVLFTWFLVMAAGLLKAHSMRRVILAGLLAGLALLTRPTMFPMMPVLAIAFVLISIHHRLSIARVVGSLLILLGLPALLCSPILARNITEYDSVAMTSQTGGHFMNWIAAPILAGETGASPEQAANTLTARFFTELEEDGVDREALDPFSLSSRKFDFSMRFLAAQPATTIASYWVTGAAFNLGAPAVLIDKKIRSRSSVGFYNVKGSNLLQRIQNYIAANDTVYLAVFLLSLAGSAMLAIVKLAGMVWLIRFKPWGALFSVLYFLYFLFLTGPVLSPKYRLPLEPGLIVLAAIGLAVLWQAVASPRRHKGF